LSSDKILPAINGNVLWLIPSQPQMSVYREQIQRLSDRFGTVRFPPHLTLGRLPENFTEKELSRCLRSLTQVVNNLVSATDSGIECSTSPYQNLIHALKSSKELHQFQSEIMTLIFGYTPKEEYHVSLMYGEIGCNEVESEITNLLKRLPKRVNFSKISVIRLNGQPDDWRTLRELKF
jgi:hypothetical protein